MTEREFIKNEKKGLISGAFCSIILLGFLLGDSSAIIFGITLCHVRNTAATLLAHTHFPRN